MVESRTAVERLVTSPYRARTVLVDARHAGRSADLVTACLARGAEVLVAPREVVEATVGFRFHRGVVAVAERPGPADPGAFLARCAGPGPGNGGGVVPVLLVAEGLTDVENVGSVFRNAAAFGVRGVLLDPTCADPLYRRAVRVSMGHVLHVPFARATTWPGELEEVRRAGFAVAALAPRPVAGGPEAVAAADLGAWWRQRVHQRPGSVGIALLLGAEGPGLTSAARAAADAVVSIPMAAGVDSLNVATAAAVALFATTF